MGKVINIKSAKASKAGAERGATAGRIPPRMQEEVKLLKKISDEIDAVILKHLETGKVDPIDLAGLLSHRLGTLIGHIEQKAKLWDVCQKVLKKQANLE